MRGKPPSFPCPLVLHAPGRAYTVTPGVSLILPSQAAQLPGAQSDTSKVVPPHSEKRT